MEQLRIRVSRTIANEWCGRGISDVIPDLPEFDVSGGVLCVSVAIANEILADCKFNGDARNGPEEMPGGTRRAYRALAKQVGDAIAHAVAGESEAGPEPHAARIKAMEAQNV